MISNVMCHNDKWPKQDESILHGPAVSHTKKETIYICNILLLYVNNIIILCCCFVSWTLHSVANSF